MDKSNFLSSFKTLKVSVVDNSKILLVEINRQKSLNAMNGEVFQDLNDLFSNISKITNEVDIRVVILQGAGRNFSSGLDLKSDIAMNLATYKDYELDTGRKAYILYNSITKLQNCFTAIEKCHLPVIASIRGYCFGAGINLITCCDFAICSKNALFSVKEATIGLVADIGFFQRAIKNNGNIGLIKKLSFTGENFGWELALKMGIVVEVAEDEKDLDAKVLSLAGKIAEMSPVVNWGIKRIINFSRENSINDSLDMIATMNSALIQGNEVESSVKAVLTKTKAIYPKL